MLFLFVLVQRQNVAFPNKVSYFEGAEDLPGDKEKGMLRLKDGQMVVVYKTDDPHWWLGKVGTREQALPSMHYIYIIEISVYVFLLDCALIYFVRSPHIIYPPTHTLFPPACRHEVGRTYLSTLE